MQDSVKVFYVGGMGRSGSTLLGRLLGSLPGYVHVGEFEAIWERLGSETMCCGCGCVFSECSFWREVSHLAFGDVDPKFYQEMGRIRQSLLHRGNYPALLLGRTTQEQQVFLKALAGLYQAVATASGARVIIDITKHPPYAYLLRLIPGIDLRFAHLVRDSRAVAFSWQRRKLTPAFVQETYMMRLSWLQSLRAWNVRNVFFHACRPSARGIRLHYEDMTATPSQTLSQCFDLLDEPAESLGFLNGRPLLLGREHSVGGNPHRYNPELVIQSDEEWRDKMPWAAKAIVTAGTLPLLAYYGYLSGSRANREPDRGHA